ncbi:MAG: adenosylcobalamin-dependent ribonucleoside-diphosphate reductase [Cyclobacteriaceae bacterium]|nr:adenosylcobalamin-dependent ribonucleoside-diphosphate reductase [Cyclobacteriaceae bacterium HetDA_MAG_MS6]
MSKYALKNIEGDFLESSPTDMHHRLAKAFITIEKAYGGLSPQSQDHENLSNYGQTRKSLIEKQIFEFFKDFKYVIPQGGVMSGLGNPHTLASLSNCVVMPEIFDSYSGILHTDQELVQLFKRRCGVGIDISNLRPAGSVVSNAAMTTTGAVSFMERFSNTTREVAQHGRRGALMITMDIAHPDIEEFIKIKQDLTKITGANISVRLSDEFMEAINKDKSFLLRWPIASSSPKITKTIKAKKLWQSIIECAHNTAEPGLIFWDRQHRYSTSSVYPEFKNVSTNPCSEIAMQGGDSCRLIALNLFSFVKNPFTAKSSFDFDKFYKVTYEAQRLMDDLVDLELQAVDRIISKIHHDPEPDHIKKIELDTWQLLKDTGRKGRRTGLGFTALADAMAAIGLKFDSDKSIAKIRKIMKVKCQAEFDSSIDMAIERGAFQDFDPEIEQTSDFVKMLAEEFPMLHGRMMKHGRRNISISTVAPTGSLSLLAQTSSGIEPIFLTSYKRRRKVSETNNQKTDFVDSLGDAWEEFTVYHPKLKSWMQVTGETDENKSPYAGATASEIDWKQRLNIQAEVQKYVTHSISSTINLANNVSKEMVANIYMAAWQKGLKGITVYRDGSRDGVLISTQKEKPCGTSEIRETQAPSRPKKLEAEVIRFQNNNEKWMAVVGLLNQKPYEIFTGKAEDSFHLASWVTKGWVIKKRNAKGKSRYDFQFLDKDGYRVTVEGLSRSFNKEYWNYAKLISGVLRHGMPIQQVVDLVDKLNLYDQSINTWKNGVARTLRRFVPDGTKAKGHNCPECGDPDGLVYEEGCLHCKSCGHTKCD